MTLIAELLRKLSAEVSTEELDAAFRSAWSSVEKLPVDEREDNEQLLQLLGDVRGMVERNRRRARELRALFETAGDLSALHDEEDVLKAIVRRGRQLLGTDVAYLMLDDQDRGDTYMRVTEGTTTSGFPGIRLPMGVGLGGRVAEGLTPHWTRNYMRDQRFTHVIDDVVDDERLVAILGVPLKIGQRRLGVLFAADRQERDFTQDEVSLLASLADHAAIAIETAALFQESQAAVAALTAANAVIEKNRLTLESAVRLHDRLMDVVAHGGTVQAVMESLVDILDGQVLVLDEYGGEIARASSRPEPLDAASEELVERAIDQANAGNFQRLDEKDLSVVVTRVLTGTHALGSLIYVSRQIRDGEVRALERTAAAISLLLANRRALDEADNRLRGEILAEMLIAAEPDVTAIKRRARLLDVELERDHIVVVVLPIDGTVSRSLQVETANFARFHHGLVTSYADRVVMLLPGADAGDIARTVASRLARGHATVGGAGPVRDLGRLRQSEDTARRTAALLAALDRPGEGVSADELGIYGLVLSELGKDHARSFVDLSIGPLRKYDARRGTALLATLRAYFANEGNVAAVAEEMFIHVNTVYQRLERLEDLLGEGWRRGDRSLELRLALRLEQLL